MKSTLLEILKRMNREMRTKDELKEQLLSTLKAHKGEKFTPSELNMLFPVKVKEKELFAQAFGELIDEKKIVNYVTYNEG